MPNQTTVWTVGAMTVGKDRRKELLALMHWRTWFNTLDLIHVLNYYLMLAFLISMVLRIRSYRAILGLIFACRNRWPRLMELVKKHRSVFLGWPTLLAIALAFAIMIVNFLVTHWIWPQARVRVGDLWGHWLPFGAVLLSGGVMLFFDFKATFSTGQFDRADLEANLDNAESWLKSWMSPTLRIVTLGFVSPRRIVGAQVHQSLVDANWIVIGGMWRMSLRIGIRLAFGLSIWLTWAFVVRGTT